MRLYLAADRSALETLRDGGSVMLPAFVAASDDEEDEFSALTEAAETGTVAIAVDVDAVDDGDDQTVTLAQVAALHLDVDGSGDLAWFATQELDVVIDMLG